MQKKEKYDSPLGAHMSIEGGFYRAIERGEKIGCTALQLFTKSNRQWQAKPITQTEIARFKEAWKASPITFITAHASYLINIGSPDQAVAHKSLKALILELERCAALGISTLVLHPGSRLTSTKEECLEQVTNNINSALEATEKTIVVVETMAGQGSNIGSSFEDLAVIIKHVKQKHRIGVAMDTCHLFAAGYDIATQNGFLGTLKQFDDTIGIDQLRLIHLNDSKQPLGSHVDRHEEIGKGKIGLEGFSLIMNSTQLAHIPKILETPDPDKYAYNMEILRDLTKK